MSFQMPELKTAKDAAEANAALFTAVADGDLTRSEAAELGKLLDCCARADHHHLEARLSKLESERTR